MSSTTFDSGGLFEIYIFSIRMLRLPSTFLKSLKMQATPVFDNGVLSSEEDCSGLVPFQMLAFDFPVDFQVLRDFIPPAGGGGDNLGADGYIASDAVESNESAIGKWQMLINPRHIAADGERYLGMHIRVVPPLPEGLPHLDVFYKLGILDGEGQHVIVAKWSTIRRFTFEQNSFGWDKFFPFAKFGDNPPPKIGFRAELSAIKAPKSAEDSIKCSSFLFPEYHEIHDVREPVDSGDSSEEEEEDAEAEDEAVEVEVENTEDIEEETQSEGNVDNDNSDEDDAVFINLNLPKAKIPFCSSKVLVKSPVVAQAFLAAQAEEDRVDGLVPVIFPDLDISPGGFQLFRNFCYGQKNLPPILRLINIPFGINPYMSPMFARQQTLWNFAVHLESPEFLQFIFGFMLEGLRVYNIGTMWKRYESLTQFIKGPDAKARICDFADHVQEAKRKFFFVNLDYQNRPFEWTRTIMMIAANTK